MCMIDNSRLQQLTPLGRPDRAAREDFLIANPGYAKQVSPVGCAPNKLDTMCPNDSATCSTPLLYERCFDSELNSDVTFLVGPESELSRIPGHRSVLAAASPVFRAMFEGSLADGPVVTIPDVDRRAFDQLLRYMYGERVQLQSVSTALTTLYAAHKYEAEGLELLCISYLSGHLDSSCVLDIYHDMLVYNNIASASSRLYNWAPSAPPIDAVESSEVTVQPNSQDVLVPKTTCENTQGVPSCYAKLLKKCLEYIDYHADDVLKQEQLEELSEHELRSIAERDTLGVSSEKVLFQALERWCNCKCKCNQWELSPEKRRKALGKELLFSVRFLLMSSEDFMSGPMSSNLLDQLEIKILLAHILKHSKIQKGPEYIDKVLPTLQKKRLKPPPVIMKSSDSAASSRRNSGIATSKGSFSGISFRSGKKTPKKQRNPRSVEERNLEERKPNLTDYFFSCIACIFD